MSEVELHLIRQRMAVGPAGQGRPRGAGGPAAGRVCPPGPPARWRWIPMSRSRRSSGWCSGCSISWVRCTRCCGSWSGTRYRSGCGSGPGPARGKSPGGHRISRAWSTCCGTRPMPGSTPTGAAAPIRSRRLPGREHSGRVRGLDTGQWLVRIDGALPAYISVEQYERNLARMAANRARAESMGAPREGPALLGGLVACGICGQRMQVSYEASGQALTGRYCCQRRHHTYGEPRCQQMAAAVPRRACRRAGAVGAGPGRAGAVGHRRGAGRGPPGRGRPDLAAAAGTRGLRLRPGAAPVSAGRAGEPPGGPPARARVGSRAGRAGAPGRGVPAVPAAAPGPAVTRRAGRDPCPGRRHPGAVVRADDHRRRPQAADPRRHRVRPGHRRRRHRARARRHHLGRRPPDPRRPAPPGGPDRPAVVLPGPRGADQRTGRAGPGQRRDRRRSSPPRASAPPASTNDSTTARSST